MLHCFLRLSQFLKVFWSCHTGCYMEQCWTVRGADGGAINIHNFTSNGLAYEIIITPCFHLNLNLAWCLDKPNRTTFLVCLCRCLSVGIAVICTVNFDPVRIPEHSPFIFNLQRGKERLHHLSISLERVV